MALTSTSSSFNLESKYDVFLSFRGEDTRHNFTSHLYAALSQKQISAFIDDDGLKRGDEISPAILKAIEGSKISVIILSKDYASSRWCLEELEKILACRRLNGQMVVPVFYRINPSDVQKQTGSFEDAFRKHEERFKEVPERVQRWRAALTEVAHLSGWDSMVIRSESKLVEGIVGDIWKKLIELSPLNDNFDGLVGMDSHIETIKSLLLESKVVGIWGMGGIGKTTIAKTLFIQISRQFDGCCFIENVTDELKRCGGQLVNLQQKIISRILGEENYAIDTLNIIYQLIKDRLQRKKVLIILDDVNDYRQLKLLMGELEPLNPRSRIIITSRDKQVLSSYGMNKIYEVQELKDDEALLLFCKHAFKQNHPFEHLQELSKMTIAYAKGNPLALEVLGLSLCGKKKEEWESVVHDLKMIGGTQIHDVLKISYNTLNKIEKSIFLDVACFFKGENKDHALKILEACYKSLPYSLSVLIDKSLIKISMDDKLEMHDLLKEMGQRIVCQESDKKPDKHSRLWDHEDIYRVLQNNEGTNVVESILLDMSRSREIHLSSKAFMNMTNLRLLKFYWPGRYFEDHANISKVCLPQGLEYLPNELRYLHWDGFPLKALPLKFNPEKLVALELPYSKIEEILKETKQAINFESIICFSKQLIDFLKPKHIKPEGCKRLLKAPSPIQHFRNLQYLNMRECYGLGSFPTNIHFTSPITLILCDCINLTEFPKVSGNIRQLHLSRTAIEEVPTSIAGLTKLVKLNLRSCKRLKRISTGICKLRSLSSLDASDCLKLESFPEIMEEMKGLKLLDLSRTRIEELPSSIQNLTGLECLTLRGCENLKTIPSIKKLSKLDCLYLTDCNMLQMIPELPLGLTFCEARNCKKLEALPEPPTNIEELDQECEPKRKMHICSPRTSFFFENCLNLEQNIPRQRIQQMAKAFRYYHEKVIEGIPNLMFMLPGSKIPGWFNHQSFGSSITIELPQNWCDKGLIGFALSATVPYEALRRHSAFYSDPACICSYGDGKEYLIDLCIPDDIKSDHIIIGFVDLRLHKGHYTTVKFEFKELTGGELIIKSCGVCPLYEEPNMERLNENLTDEDLTESMLVGCPKRKFDDANASGGGVRGSDEEDAVDPNPKRNCRS